MAVPESTTSNIEQPTSDVEQGKGAKKTASAASAASAAKTASDASEKTPLFPTPQFVFNIFSPKEITTSENNIAQQNLIKSRWKPFTFDTKSTADNPRKVRVKLASLIVKMLNRFIKEKMLPKENIYILMGQSHIFVQILCASSALSTLMQRCERIGVGNVVGACFASPLECSLSPWPSSGPLQLFDTSLYAATKEQPIATSSAGETKTVPTTQDDDDDDDDDYISSDEEEEVTKVSVPSTVGVPFLSEKRKKELAQKIIDARNEWLNTASNVRVEQVAEEVRASAAMTWDYIMFVVCAATVAAIGLATDSATTTIASMLISPIMGPVMSFTFGTTVRKKELCVVGLRNEVISLVICLLIGIFWGIIAAVARAPVTRDWPSQEMLSRGDPFGLSSGVLVAIPSGVATALSTLGRNSSGMVGVAISLSLLPPAVNCGICWSYAAMLKAPPFERNEGDDTDYVITGGISIALTMINIVCIWLSGIFTFWLKEVAPISRKNSFWTRDVKNYREQDGTVGALQVDTEVINEGIEAALELQQDAGNGIYEGDFDIDLNKSKVAAARREGLATNAWEDAMFLNQDFGMDGKAIVGGAADGVIPDQITLENVKRRNAATKSLIDNANQLGGLGEAGETLFDNNILPSFDDSVNLPSDADGVNHAAVAKKILLQKHD